MAENREILSMYFSSLHLPPLPMIAQKIDGEDNSVIDDEAVESSHDVLAGLMSFTCSNMTPRDHNERQMHQLKLQHDFYGEVNDIEDIDSMPDAEIYDLYARHTREWMRAYTRKLNNHYASFKPYDYVANGDKIHAQMQSYAKAQCFLHTNGKTEVQLESSVPYLSMMRMCAKYSHPKWLEQEGGLFAAKEENPSPYGDCGGDHSSSSSVNSDLPANCISSYTLESSSSSSLPSASE